MGAKRPRGVWESREAAKSVRKGAKRLRCACEGREAAKSVREGAKRQRCVCEACGVGCVAERLRASEVCGLLRYRCDGAGLPF